MNVRFRGRKKIFIEVLTTQKLNFRVRRHFVHTFAVVCTLYMVVICIALYSVCFLYFCFQVARFFQISLCLFVLYNIKLLLYIASLDLVHYCCFLLTRFEIDIDAIKLEYTDTQNVYIGLSKEKVKEVIWMYGHMRCPVFCLI